jgi:hypothetical protein
LERRKEAEVRRKKKKKGLKFSFRALKFKVISLIDISKFN